VRRLLSPVSLFWVVDLSRLLALQVASDTEAVVTAVAVMAVAVMAVEVVTVVVTAGTGDQVVGHGATEADTGVVVVAAGAAMVGVAGTDGTRTGRSPHGPTQ